MDYQLATRKAQLRVRLRKVRILAQAQAACGEEIAEKRLRALPFAVRCKDCEEAREIKQQRDRLMAQRRGAASLFIDMQG